MKKLKLSVAASAAVVCVMTAGLASAQQAGGSASASGQAGMALPSTTAQAAATSGDSDHDQVVGSFAVGYMGASGVPIATSPPAGATVASADITAPTVGVRYWVNQLLGIDVGLGVGMQGGSVTGKTGGASQTIDDQGNSAFLIHGGVPLSLASTGHFSFEIVPELNVGFANSTHKAPTNPANGQPTGPEIDYSGFMFNIGARAGAEIHFGFMGIPRLALQGSVGLLYQMNQVKADQKAFGGAQEISVSHSTWHLGTTVQQPPWAIFVDNISALYYF